MLVEYILICKQLEMNTRHGVEDLVKEELLSRWRKETEDFLLLE